MLLFYLRHGDPCYQPDSLTPLGQAQAQALAKRLALFGIDRIFASTSNRAVQTARPTADLLAKPITLLDFCNEDHVWYELTVPKEPNGKTWLFASPEYRKKLLDPEVTALGERWYDHPDFQQFPSFRTGTERVRRETDRWLSSLGLEHDRERHLYRITRPNDERIALFAHQGFGMAFLSSVLDLPYPQFSTHFDLGHSSMTVVEFSEVEDGLAIAKILTLSNDSHLYREGLPLRYNRGISF